MTDLNPHQFGDQLTLFHAPLGQPESGTFNGNPHARLYRALHVPDHVTTPEAAFEHASQPHRDRGHSTRLGIHWQHDYAYAQDLADTAHSSDWGGHGDDSHSVILEADHPGHEHVIDQTPVQGGGPPEGIPLNTYAHDRLTGYQKDWALINDTVGPHNLNSAMLPEVPVRPGAPMQIHAVHFPHPTKSGEYVRVPFKARGLA